MEDPVTVRELMTREFVGVTESDSLQGTAELLAAEDAACAVVLRGGDPVGLVTATRALAALVDGVDGETPVASVMSDPPRSLSLSQPLDAAVAALSESGRWHALVTGEEGVVGLVDARDVLAARASRPPASGADAEGPATFVRSGEAAATNGGAYSAQGVCEVCGSLARELADVNGQLVCSDCRSV